MKNLRFLMLFLLLSIAKGQNVIVCCDTCFSNQINQFAMKRVLAQLTGIQQLEVRILGQSVSIAAQKENNLEEFCLLEQSYSYRLENGITIVPNSCGFCFTGKSRPYCLAGVLNHSLRTQINQTEKLVIQQKRHYCQEIDRLNSIAEAENSHVEQMCDEDLSIERKYNLEQALDLNNAEYTSAYDKMLQAKHALDASQTLLDGMKDELESVKKLVFQNPLGVYLTETSSGDLLMFLAEAREQQKTKLTMIYLSERIINQVKALMEI